MNAKTSKEKSAAPSAPRPGRPRNPDVDRALLDATLLELAENGFSGMSLEGVAARSGIGKTAIYRRYAGKVELVVATLAELAAKVDTPTTGDLVLDLTRQLEAAYSNLELCGGAPLLGTLLAECERHPELIGVYRQRLFEPRAAKLLAILSEAQARGEINKRADLRTTSLLLLGFLSGSYISAQGVDRVNLRKAVEQVVAGLSPRPR